MIPSVTVPCGEKGAYRIERKHVKPRPHIDISGRYVPEGEYTFLYHGNTLMMSDTPDEKRDHHEAVHQANGRCLIAGLGIGMVLNAVAMKECVSHIDVVEISQDVIDLVLPHYSALYPGKIECYCASIFDWKPAKGVMYNMAWFDIWNDLCTDNLKAMEQLHRKFARKAKWKGSWGKSHLQWHLKRFGW